MLNGYRFRLYPDQEQERLLLRWIGCRRLIYNAKVQEDRYYRKFQRRFVALAGMSVPIDQEYSRFITEDTAFLREVPSQVLRNGATLWRQAYARFFAGLGGRPKHKTKTGRQAVWLTSELFEFVPEADPSKGTVVRRRLRIGTAKFPVGEISYRAHRPHGIPASIHVSVEAGGGSSPSPPRIRRFPAESRRMPPSTSPKTCATCRRGNSWSAPWEPTGEWRNPS